MNTNKEFRPCPLCAVALDKCEDINNQRVHPLNGCALDGMIVDDNNLESWNRRADDISDEELNERLQARGMFTIDEMLKSASNFEIHVGMTDLAFYRTWLENKVREYSTMRAKYELGIKDCNDDLYVWVLAHSAAYREALVCFYAARS